MTKAELAKVVAEKAGLSAKDADKAIAATLEAIKEAVAKGDKVSFIGFGTFEARARGARVARNPRTGEKITIAAAKVPAFKAGKALKDAVNN